MRTAVKYSKSYRVVNTFRFSYENSSFNARFQAPAAKKMKTAHLLVITLLVVVVIPYRRVGTEPKRG